MQSRWFCSHVGNFSLIQPPVITQSFTPSHPPPLTVNPRSTLSRMLALSAWANRSERSSSSSLRLSTHFCSTTAMWSWYSFIRCSGDTSWDSAATPSATSTSLMSVPVGRWGGWVWVWGGDYVGDVCTVSMYTWVWMCVSIYGGGEKWEGSMAHTKVGVANQMHLKMYPQEQELDASFGTTACLTDEKQNIKCLSIHEAL